MKKRHHKFHLFKVSAISLITLVAGNFTTLAAPTLIYTGSMSKGGATNQKWDGGESLAFKRYSKKEQYYLVRDFSTPLSAQLITLNSRSRTFAVETVTFRHSGYFYNRTRGYEVIDWSRTFTYRKDENNPIESTESRTPTLVGTYASFKISTAPSGVLNDVVPALTGSGYFWDHSPLVDVRNLGLQTGTEITTGTDKYSFRANRPLTTLLYSSNSSPNDSQGVMIVRQQLIAKGYTEN